MSLQACVARHLRERLDKTEQCSDWAARPLSDSQVAYAALDAAVLLRLAATLAGPRSAPQGSGDVRTAELRLLELGAALGAYMRPYQ